MQRMPCPGRKDDLNCRGKKTLLKFVVTIHLLQAVMFTKRGGRLDMFGDSGLIQILGEICQRALDHSPPDVTPSDEQYSSWAKSGAPRSGEIGYR